MPPKRIKKVKEYEKTYIDVDNYEKCKLSTKKTYILVIVESPGKIKKIWLTDGASNLEELHQKTKNYVRNYFACFFNCC